MTHPHKPYPETRAIDHVDSYHGVEIADPYRWLEDLDGEDTAAWVRAQNEVTFDYLEGIQERPAIRQRLEQLWDFEKFGVPVKSGSRYFMQHNDGLRNQPVLLTTTSLDEEFDVLLDPNTWSADGTVAMTAYRPSRSGDLLAYNVADAGSDWVEWRILDARSGEPLPDRLRWVKFSTVSWLPDDSGMFYSRYAEPGADAKLEDMNRFQKLYFHRLGTEQSEDRLVYERPDQPEWGFDGQVTEDGAYLIITVWAGTDRRTRLYFQPLDAPDAQVVELLDEFDARYLYVGNDGPVFYVWTDRGAPNGRIVAIDTRDPDPSRWRDVIGTTNDAIAMVGLIGERFFVTYLRDARNVVGVFDMTGASLHELELPGMGSVVGFDGRRDDSETFFLYTSFTTPGEVYRLEVGSPTPELFRRPKLAFDPERFVTEQVFFSSKDGTRVPMFVTRHRDTTPAPSTPAYLYGYGGFGISLTPAFSVGALAWMERGGLYVIANLRGGGEYGERWREAGMKHNKQNVFDDFQSAAEALIEQGYTSTPKLAIGGGSNGGLLVGACITQRPQLFGAAIAAVGVLDMLRFHRFTIGWAWVSDYGSPDDPEMFKALRSYSPLHNVTEGTAYPPTLIVTGDHDDRVVPSHSFKFAAAMQRAQGSEAPVLIRVEVRAGHGLGKPTDKLIEESADVWSFLGHVLQVPAAAQ